MRGGVSLVITLEPPSGMSSPRAWGCFLPSPEWHQSGEVFPTCVGVFLNASAPQAAPRRRLPHVRGGVSKKTLGVTTRKGSSPRAWGCFQVVQRGPAAIPVFPTCVGVFLFERLNRLSAASLPHVRGGVSKGIKNDYYQKSSSLRAWECFRTSGALRGPLKGENHVYDH